MFPSEKQLTGAKRLKQEVYRASLERQVEQKNRRIAEEVRESNAHPLGSGYTQAKPTFWQASTQVRANRKFQTFRVEKLNYLSFHV